MPSLRAQMPPVPQFDNADFDGANFPGFCFPGYFPAMENCGVTDVDWWMWKEFDQVSGDYGADVKAGFFHNNYGCYSGNSLFFVEKTNDLPLFATRNPIWNSPDGSPLYILLKLQQKPEFADLGTYAEHLKVYGTNQKDILEPNATAVEVGVSYPLPANGDCNSIKILLDPSAKNYEYLGFAFSEPSVPAFPTVGYMDDLSLRRLFHYKFVQSCVGFCIETNGPVGVPNLHTNPDWVFEFYLNDHLIYEPPSGWNLKKKICFPYSEYEQFYNSSGTNEFKILFADNELNDYVTIVNENFEFFPNVDVVIPSGETTWSLSNVPNSGKMKSLLLLDGATLTINPDVTLTFPKDGELDINPGGWLKNKGTLTSCDDFWQGVRAIGNENLSQVPSSNQGRYYGYPKSVIENAKIGVMNCESSSNNRGGIIKAYKSIFKNNEIAVQMLGKGTANEVPIATPDVSFFKYSTFVVDEHISPSLTFKSFVEYYFMNMSKTSALAGNTFNVDVTLKHPPVPNFGVYSFISTFSSFRNKFYRLHEGVSANGSSYFGSQAYFANYNDFEDCRFGIHNRGVSGSLMNNNDFILGNVPVTYHNPNPTNQKAQVGIIMESHIADFKMEDNTFDAKGGNHHNTIGSQCTNMGTNYYEIRRNHYTNLQVGNVAYLRNGWKKGKKDFDNGLTYLCNENTGNGAADFYVADGSIIHPVQKYEENDATLNTFSYAPGIEWDFGNLGGTNVKYYYDPNFMNNTPRDGFIAGINKIDKPTPNHCYVQKGPKIGKEDFSLVDVTENRQKYFAEHSQYLVAKNELQQAALQQNDALAETKRKQTYAHKIAADEAAFMGYLYAVLDSTGASADSIPLWLGRMERLESDLALAGWYRQDGQPETAKMILDGLQQKYQATGDQMDELDKYFKTLDLVADQPLTDLNESVLNQLRLLAVDDGSLSSAFAKNTLSLYGEYFPPVLVDVAINTDNTSTSETAADGPRMQVSPNPTDSYVHFDWSDLGLDDAPVTIELRDKMGLLLQTTQGVPGEYTKEVSLETFQAGIIYYHLISNGQELDSGQIILSK